MPECIHGFADGLCDTCFPKPASEKPAAPPKAPRVPRVSKISKSTEPRPVAVNIGEQRIYHVTHIRNLESILQSGCLLADANGAAPVVDISSAGNREERRSATVCDSDTVAQYVPFFVSPNSAVWEDLRAGIVDPRIAPDARNFAASDFVVLVSTVSHADRENSILSMSDAADAGATVASNPDLVDRELRRLPANEQAVREAEFLVRESFPFESVTLIGVAHDKARDAVKPIVAGSAFSTKIAVYPPWFARD